jgi:hypothetical protein
MIQSNSGGIMFNPKFMHAIDLGVVIIANLINLLLVVMFLARAAAGTRENPVERGVSLVILAMAIPLAGALVINLLAKRGAWYAILPAMTIAFLALELILDYVLKIDFRNMGKVLAPYLILYYLNQFAMIGYSFMVAKPYGFLTLVTYFINLAATFYSFARVKHG